MKKVLKNNRKNLKLTTLAFTLIELLAVLVILAIIALIIFPIIGNTINSSKKKAFLRSVKGLENAAKLDYQKDDYKGNRIYQYKDSNFKLIEVNDENKNDNINVEGMIKDGVGKIYIDKKGETSVVVHNKNWCATKEVTDKLITIEEKTNDNCFVPKTFEELLEENIDTNQVKKDNTVDQNLRYVGKLPNNYIWFNKERWRVIGVFNRQAKIIRHVYYSDAIEWDEDDGNYSNNWATASLKSLLNDGDSSFLKTIEINDPTSYNHIDLEHVWNIGGTTGSTSTWTRENMYNFENGKIPAGTSGSEKNWIGAIGLMYPSDYGYSTSGNETTCDETIYIWNTGDYKAECAKKSWLYDSNYTQWTMTPLSNYSNRVFFVRFNGHMNFSSYVYNTNAAKPVLYLKPNTNVIGGKGTEQEPYILDQ